MTRRRYRTACALGAASTRISCTKESLYRSGQTRITFLFNDSFAEGQPLSAGPVRSARIGHVLLREEWQGRHRVCRRPAP